jgi:hypothetical protein
MAGGRGDQTLILAKDFNYMLGKQDGYAQAPFNWRIGGAYEKGYKEGQKLYNDQQRRGQGPR